MRPLPLCLHRPTCRPTTDDALISCWLDRHSWHSAHRYGAVVRAMRRALALPDLDYFQTKPLATITLADLHGYLDTLADRPSAWMTALAAIRSLFTFAHQRGYLHHDVAAPLAVPRWRPPASSHPDTPRRPPPRDARGPAGGGSVASPSGSGWPLSPRWQPSAAIRPPRCSWAPPGRPDTRPRLGGVP